MLIYAASTQRWIFIVIASLVMLGFLAYLWVNVFRTGTREVGSEIELAPNRKPYYDDEELETTRLDRSLLAGVSTLAIVAISLPLYWLGEPGRQEGRVEFTDDQFAGRGEELFEANCVNCHSVGAVGGVAPYTVLDDQGRFVASPEGGWVAPALTTILERYSREELFEILQYGRPQSPMPAWGSLGGGPLTDQRLEEIIEYLSRIQLSSEETEAAVQQGLRDGIEADIRKANPELFAAASAVADEDATDEEIEAHEAAVAAAREAVFAAMNEAVPGLGDLRAQEQRFGEELLSAESPAAEDAALEGLIATREEIDRLLDRTFAELPIEEQGRLLYDNEADGGSYSCARCHTAGASWDADGILTEDPRYEGLINREVPGGGGFGPSLIGVQTQFANAREHASFIAGGCNQGDQYGLNGFCDSGQMPAFGSVLTPEQIDAVVAYERSLG